MCIAGRAHKDDGLLRQEWRSLRCDSLQTIAQHLKIEAKDIEAPEKDQESEH